MARGDGRDNLVILAHVLFIFLLVYSSVRTYFDGRVNRAALVALAVYAGALVWLHVRGR